MENYRQTEMEKYGPTNRHGWGGGEYRQTEIEKYGVTDRHGWRKKTIDRRKSRNTV